jgi:hypothetical protein
MMIEAYPLDHEQLLSFAMQNVPNNCGYAGEHGIRSFIQPKLISFGFPTIVP